MDSVIINFRNYCKQCIDDRKYLDYNFPENLSPLQKVFKSIYIWLKSQECYANWYIHTAWFAFRVIINNKFNKITDIEKIKEIVTVHNFQPCYCDTSVIKDDMIQYPNLKERWNNTCMYIKFFVNKLLSDNNILPCDWIPTNTNITLSEVDDFYLDP